ncbi:MAG: MoaD/ThiS family protein [Candidatus Binatia bacterium]|jgi:molybdopterin converting factor small subunit|nr:MoaD/ThiS family protein [Candidatus Binatia bacterium]MDG1957575.1 MoaD/ThiS family protein [Candidatus Binatia bacterium]MDG2010722.1 MoaD/ThiS family protein [Candidatus Binatia bacterium]
MKVTIKLFAGLRKFAPEGGSDEIELELPEGATAEDAVSALGIPEGHAGAAFINNERADLTVSLAEGQVVGLIPPLGGG